MSQQEPPGDQADSTPETKADSTFFDGIEFLTGKDPNFGSFLLVVGIVTCVFIALFQFTLPTPISHLLTAGVIFVTVLSAIFGSLLDSLGYFERISATAPEESVDRRPAARPWVPAEERSAPLPPLINFDAELRAYADMYEGDLPSEFDPFVSDYLRLKTNTDNRATIASDLRADLNPIGTLFEDGSEGDRIYEDISDRLFRYISAKSDPLTLDRVTFYDGDGNEADVTALKNQLAHVELEVSNEGEAAEVEATVTLRDADDAAIISRTCDVGLVRPGATKAVDADVFVPSDAERASATVRISGPGRTVAGA
ncbi:hypothetical protein ACFR9U_08210 [Halorientalis brevis]|uniref:Uncharacterized protein n=1 Tax=Halorientalis brevis TaxID=1126241 RepID=A0ABD6CAS4_9EURY|nr:hypothetical protein [Halorientalis brevis]